MYNINMHLRKIGRIFIDWIRLAPVEMVITFRAQKTLGNFLVDEQLAASQGLSGVRQSPLVI
jgi:hypothetical protein